MNKVDMIDTMARTFSISKDMANQYIAFVLDMCHDKAMEEDYVKFDNHKFSKKIREARKGRDPRNGAVIDIPQKVMVVYKHFGK